MQLAGATMAWPVAGTAATSSTPPPLALLVGAGQVQALPERLWLEGPANDVALMHSTLQAQGFAKADVQVLASGVPGTAAPTLVAVQTALGRLIQAAGPGVQVVLYFAGHGAQVPTAASRRREADGQDEVLLLHDVQPWKGTAREGHLPNALRDETLAAAVQALCQRGAQVWTLLDTCHAAGFTRGGPLPPGQRHRSVAAVELGVPLPDWEQASARPGAAAVAPAGALWLPPTVPVARRVYAMASRAREPALEERLPSGPDGTLRMHGTFTWSLAQWLRQSAGPLTPASLRAGLLAQYAALGRVAPVPQVLGDPALRWPGRAG